MENNNVKGEEQHFMKVTISHEGVIHIEENIKDKLRLIGLFDAGKQIMLNKIFTPSANGRESSAVAQNKKFAAPELPDSETDS